MTSEADIGRATSLILDRLDGGFILAENDRAVHRAIGAGTDLSVNTVKRAMSRLIRSGRVSKSPRSQPIEKGMGPAKAVYSLRRAL